MPKTAVSLTIKSALLCIALSLLPGAALAQGSAGGSIGNEDKGLSGSREASPAQPEEISPAYVFLASPVCASYISGIVLPVMGGPMG